MRDTVVIVQGDLARLESLLNVFDRVSYNPSALPVAQMNVNLPVFGSLTISYLANDMSLCVFRGDEDAIINERDYPMPASKEELLADILDRLKAAAHNV